jgi:hypothetical protein
VKNVVELLDTITVCAVIYARSVSIDNDTVVGGECTVGIVIVDILVEE